MRRHAAHSMLDGPFCRELSGAEQPSASRMRVTAPLELSLLRYGRAGARGAAGGLAGGVLAAIRRKRAKSDSGSGPILSSRPSFSAVCHVRVAQARRRPAAPVQLRRCRAARGNRLGVTSVGC